MKFQVQNEYCEKFIKSKACFSNITIPIRLESAESLSDFVRFLYCERLEKGAEQSPARLMDLNRMARSLHLEKLTALSVRLMVWGGSNLVSDEGRFYSHNPSVPGRIARKSRCSVSGVLFSG